MSTIRAMSPARSWPAALGLAACAILLACQVLWIDEPWDKSMAGYNSGAHYGKTCRVWDAHGAFRCRLRPTAFSSTAFFEPYVGYLNHPPTPYFLVYPLWRALGRNERAARVPILALLALSMFWLYRAVRLAAGAGEGWMTLVLYGSLPILFAHGNIVDAPAFSMVLLIPGVSAWMKWRDRPGTRGYATYFLFAYLGGITDWFSYFVVPALWLDMIIARPPGRRFWRTAFMTGLPFGIGLLTYLAWLAWADADQFFSILKFLGSTADPGTHGGGLQSRRAFAQVYKGLGPAHAAVAGAGLLVVLGRLASRRLGSADRTALALFIAGILPSVAFFVRVHDHEFWSMTAAPGYAALGARALASLRSIPRAGTVLALAGALAAAGLGARAGVALHDSYRYPVARDRALALDEYVDPADVILRPHGLGPDVYYLDAMCVPLVSKREYYELAMNNLRPARDTMGRLFILWSTDVPADPKWVTELPVIAVTQVPWPPHAGVLFELDKERAFDEIPR